MLKWIVIFMLMTTPCFGGVTFDGANDGINLGDIDGFDGEMTIAAWIRIHTSTDDSAILSQYDGVNANSAFIFRIDTTAHPSFVMNDGTAAVLVTCNPTITLNVWTHVAAVYNGSTNTDIYINGVECSTYSSTSNANISNETTPIWIGRRKDANDEADGNYLEVTAWNKTLTPGQIGLLSQNRVIRFPLQISPANILIDYPLDECSDGADCAGITFRSIASSNTGHPWYGTLGFANPVTTYQ